MGVANSDATLYDDELQQILAAYPEQFRLDYALSREGPKVSWCKFLERTALLAQNILCASLGRRAFEPQINPHLNMLVLLS